jgi:hypothetical protein
VYVGLKHFGLVGLNFNPTNQSLLFGIKNQKASAKRKK